MMATAQNEGKRPAQAVMRRARATQFGWSRHGFRSVGVWGMVKAEYDKREVGKWDGVPSC